MTRKPFSKFSNLSLIVLLLSIPVESFVSTSTNKESSDKIKLPETNISHSTESNFQSSTTESTIFSTSTEKSDAITTKTKENIETTPNTLCDNADTLELSRNPENCSEYFESCVKPSPQAISDINPKATNLRLLKEEYGSRKRSCESGQLFDDIEKLCLPQEKVDCNESYETICKNESLIYPDPIEPSVFIECFNGTAKRQHCQPRTTIFNVSLQECIKPAEKINTKNEEDISTFYPLSLSLLKSILWLVSSTKDKLSPWMVVAKVDHYLDSYNNSNVSDPENTSQIITEDNNFNDSKSNIPSEFEFEEDEILLLTNDPKYLALYYCVMVGIALGVVLSWVLIACLCNKLFGLCTDDFEDDEDDEEFYQCYNSHDKYMMTRM